ncbi:MAG: AAA family ATPase [Desulfovibrio sp.]|nr:AAA family ATPase [Desulfovibrio sp.]
MNRDMLAVLKKWKDSPRRKPMLLMGARQTGKSWILREFGRREFEHVVSIDFETDSPQVQEIGEVIRRWGLDGPAFWWRPAWTAGRGGWTTPSSSSTKSSAFRACSRPSSTFARMFPRPMWLRPAPSWALPSRREPAHPWAA